MSYFWKLGYYKIDRGDKTAVQLPITRSIFPPMPLLPEQDQTELFLEYLTASSRDIFRSIQVMVMNVDVAEDIFQDVNLVLWKKFPTFEKGTNFRAWALKIALNQVLSWRKRVSKNRLVFDEEFLMLVAEEYEKEDQVRLEQKRLLDECVESLTCRHRQLITYRYDMNLSAQEIASRTGRTLDGIRRTLGRIRKILQECTTRKSTET